MCHLKAALVLFAFCCGCTEAEPAPGNTPGAVEPTRPTAVPPAHVFKEGIEVAESQYALDSGVSPTSFNFARLRELWVRVKVVGVPPMSKRPTDDTPWELKLTLTDPNAVVAYEANAYFSPAGMQQIVLPNSAHPVTVFPAKRVPGGFVLDYGIPVSTSAITRYLSDGDWRLEAVVDGAAASHGTILKVHNVF